MNILIKKLLYRSNHRGTKEMDLLLGGFANAYINHLTEKELQEFETLLEFTDKELSLWLIDSKSNLDIEKLSVSKKIKSFKIQN
jgi:antitoxin CptB